MDMLSELFRGFIRFRGFNNNSEQNTTRDDIYDDIPRSGGREDHPHIHSEEWPFNRFNQFGGSTSFDTFEDEFPLNNPVPDNRFVFGDMFSIFGEMFNEMERSMRDMDNFFKEFENHNIPFPNYDQKALPPLQPKSNESSSIRDQMLKNDPPPKLKPEKEEMIDQDMDNLYSTLDLKQLPKPSVEAPSDNLPIIKKENTDFWDDNSNFNNKPNANNGFSQFQYSFSEFNYNNGKISGRTIKEGDNGKEVTTFSQNENGDMDKQTEFYPKNSNCPPLKDGSAGLEIDERPPNPRMSIFDRFFRPRI